MGKFFRKKNFKSKKVSVIISLSCFSFISNFITFSMEMRQISLGFYLNMMIVILSILFTKISFYVLIMSYLWFGQSVDAKTVFYIISIYRELRYCLGILIPYNIGNAAEMYSSVVRVTKMLEGEELKSKYSSEEPISNPLIEMKDAIIHIRDLEILNHVSFKTNSGLTLITGAVGSGKSSFLKVILEDYPLTSGSLTVRGRVSYASQDPWLFPSSVRQNILFGEQYDEKR